MSLIRRKVYKIRIDYVCPKCEKGKMLYQLQSVADTSFLHKCDMCKHEIYLKAEYPHFQDETELWRP